MAKKWRGLKRVVDLVEYEVEADTLEEATEKIGEEDGEIIRIDDAMESEVQDVHEFEDPPRPTMPLGGLASVPVPPPDPVARAEAEEEIAQRCARAQGVWNCYQGHAPEADEDIVDSIVDLVADLLHLAHAQGHNVADVLRTAAMHYSEEQLGGPEGVVQWRA
jgi:hypothetical protein